jgi:hypothetical protein
MKLHPRTMLVQAAHIDISTALAGAISKHQLTHAELTQILAQLLLEWNKYAIRDQREEEAKSDV